MASGRIGSFAKKYSANVFTRVIYTIFQWVSLLSVDQHSVIKASDVSVNLRRMSVQEAITRRLTYLHLTFLSKQYLDLAYGRGCRELLTPNTPNIHVNTRKTSLINYLIT